jgi:DNA polymerase-3 subunit chi
VPTLCDVWFYHLERTRLEQALPDLLEKTLAKGWRAVVRTTSPERVAHLDEWLWSYRDDSFLAHGREEDPFAARQPIIIALGQGNPNRAQALFLIDGAKTGDLSGVERCILIFDGGDEQAVTAARAEWAEFKAAGHEVAYWRQSPERGWQRQV